ncbi:c-type cytochrome [Aromatoleum toluclasticum]|uniref:c-type cytochrome n=1 Tax=Aromatoleum toluclasticum TaxID=92003 RepID=UPI000362ED95|nr:cytochrome c [Aromatoleum toluclasticum]
MKVLKRLLVLNVLAAVVLGPLSGSALAAPLKPDEQIKFRKAGYGFMAWNMRKIKGNLEGTYSNDEVAKAAAAVAAVSNSGLGALFGPGTDQDIGDLKTRVKPEFFQQADKVRELAQALNKEANELAKIATTGDVTAVKAQFGKTSDACQACHDRFRKE